MLSAMSSNQQDKLVEFVDEETRRDFLPYALPMIGDEEIAEVVDSLRSGWVTTGPKTHRFENELRGYLHASNVIAVSSCTAGLHIALRALGIGPGDEVIVPTLTFCATGNVVVQLGAHPVLVDVGNDYNILPETIEAAITPRTKAVMPVHYGGQSCDLDAVYAIALRHNLAVVEDAAHAIGTCYRSMTVGSDAVVPPGLRRAVAYSFYATKNMTTGEGGAVATGDAGLAERMRLLTLHGMSRDAWKRYSSSGSWYYEVLTDGYKCNMTDIQAAIGIHQLRKLEGFIATRQQYATRFNEAFRFLQEVEVPAVHPVGRHTFHLYPLRLNLDRLKISRNVFIEELRELNIGTSVHFIPLHWHPFYRETFGYVPGQFPNADALYRNSVSLPLYPAMSDADVSDVISAVRRLVAIHRK